MKSRGEYIDQLLALYPDGSIVKRAKGEAFEIVFVNRGYEVVFTVPESPKVREYFIGVSRDKGEIYSDWADIYKTENETEEELEQLYRDHLAKELGNYIQGVFTVIVKEKDSAKSEIVFTDP